MNEENMCVRFTTFLTVKLKDEFFFQERCKRAQYAPFGRSHRVFIASELDFSGIFCSFESFQKVLFIVCLFATILPQIAIKFE